MDIKEYTEANREAWNEVIPIHQKSSSRNLKQLFTKKGFTILDEIETTLLKDIGLEGKKVAHLCCNDGRELLSVINIGAESGVGFDISDEAIKEANELKEVSGLNCEFIRTDVYDIDEKYTNSFDLVYISIGAFNWLPDLKRFFSVASRLLKDKGMIFIYEMHPVTNMFPYEKEDISDIANALKVKYSYFSTEPWVSNNGIDYVGKSTYQAKTKYEFAHTISDVLNSLISNGINIKLFNEYSHDISACFEHIEGEAKVPLCFVLIGQKG
ncbi:MAG: class I SAM-dependent methyltransferase [Ignavibacteriales bacterium]